LRLLPVSRHDGKKSVQHLRLPGLTALPSRRSFLTHGGVEFEREFGFSILVRGALECCGGNTAEIVEEHDGSGITVQQRGMRAALLPNQAIREVLRLQQKCFVSRRIRAASP